MADVTERDALSVTSCNSMLDYSGGPCHLQIIKVDKPFVFVNLSCSLHEKSSLILLLCCFWLIDGKDPF